jgi:hypothetical protein
LAIEDYGNRASWTPREIALCKEQFIIWTSSPDKAAWIQALYDQAPLQFWEALSHSSECYGLAQYALLLCSLPMNEAENERVFSVRKFVVGDRGEMSKNQLATARVRLRLRESLT